MSLFNRTNTTETSRHLPSKLKTNLRNPTLLNRNTKTPQISGRVSHPTTYVTKKNSHSSVRFPADVLPHQVKKCLCQKLEKIQLVLFKVPQHVAVHGIGI